MKIVTILIFNRYAYDVDKTMTVLKFVDAVNKPIGMLR